MIKRNIKKNIYLNVVVSVDMSYVAWQIIDTRWFSCEQIFSL